MGGRGSSMSANASGSTNRSGGINRYDPSYDTLVTEAEIDKSMGFGDGGATDKWQNSLTVEENAQIKNYTLSGFESINKTLREGQNDQHNKEKAEEISEAISKYDLTHPIVVDRGTSPKIFGIGRGDSQKLEKIQSMAGQVIHDKGFTSTTMKRGQEFDSNVIMHIKVPKGKGIGAYVKGVSAFGDEHEFLFDKGSGFQIDGAYKDANGFVNVNMTYVGKA